MLQLFQQQTWSGSDRCPRPSLQCKKCYVTHHQTLECPSQVLVWGLSPNNGEYESSENAHCYSTSVSVNENQKGSRTQGRENTRTNHFKPPRIKPWKQIYDQNWMKNFDARKTTSKSKGLVFPIQKLVYITSAYFNM